MGKEEEVVTKPLSWKGRKGKEVDRGGIRGIWETEWNIWCASIGGG